MSDEIEVPVDDKTAGVIWRVYGLAQAFEAMGGSKPKSTLPGFALAMALVEKEMADMRANLSGAVYRMAAKAGHDVSNITSVNTDIRNGKPVVVVEPPDLVSMAD